MKRKRINRSISNSNKPKGILRVSAIPADHDQELPFISSDIHKFVNSKTSDSQLCSLASDYENLDINLDEKEPILSQDFFCTPDYVTPEDRILLNNMSCNQAMQNIHCPKSPEKNKMKTENDCHDESQIDKTRSEKQKVLNYVSKSAVALRCRVMPPPCIKNPFLSGSSDDGFDPFDIQRTKCAGLFPTVVGGDGLSRYHADFHEIQQIGSGHFSCVFKVLKRIDGCLYAIKCSTKTLHQDAEKKKALMEVQAMAALGCHENIVGYYSSWFEAEKLYIQMELCEQSLSVSSSSRPFAEGEVLQILHQIAKALVFVHGSGIAHLDVKPDNIYVRGGAYKLGDFGCATLLDQSLPVDEGDARYMPQEILNDNYNHLDKVDIFSLGVAAYQLIRGSPLQESTLWSFNIKQGKLPLLPGHSLHFQNLLKAMLDPDPARRPSAKQVLENPIFNRVQRNFKGIGK